MLGCLEDHTNLDYREINDYSDWSINGMQVSYSLFPGESVTLTPTVRLSRDTLNPAVTSSWLLDGEVVSQEVSYTFVADEKGSHELVYVATDPKTGVSFPKRVDIVVSPYNHLGWLFLSRTSAGKSHLSMVVAKRQQVPYWTKYGTRYRDSLVYVDFATDLATDVLGEQPIRLMEEYPYPGDVEPEEKSEILILQKSGLVELGESELTYTGSPLNEFAGEVPSAKIKDAAVSFTSKWLLFEDGQLYFSVANVLSDLHSGRFGSDPAFNGKKFKQLVEVMKCSDYPLPYFPVIDEEQTMWLIVDDADPKNGVEGDIINPLNYVGTVGPLRNDPQKPVDITLFKNFDGEYVQHLYVPKKDFLFSLLKRNGQYYWHRYNFNFPYTFKPQYAIDGVTVSESTLGKLSGELFSDFKDAAFAKFQNESYSNCEWLLIASGNNLYAMSMNWKDTEKQNYQKIKEFSSEIAFIQIRCFSYLNYIHVGVLLEDGVFHVFELHRDEKADSFETKEVYKQNIKQLDADIHEVVDMIHKYGNGANRFYGFVN